MDLPAETQLRWILSHTATLLQHGAEPVRGLILPTGEYFPDLYDGSPKSVGALMTRMLDHAGLTDLKVELAVIASEGGGHAGGCSGGGCESPQLAESAKHTHEGDGCGSGGCGSGKCGSEGCGSGGCGSGKCGSSEGEEAAPRRVVQREDGSYGVTLAAAELGNPVALTTAMVRAIAFMFMSEAEAYTGVIDGDREALTDLAAVMLGFGVVMANGSHIYKKGCHGVTVQSATRMPVDEITVALALFCKLFQVPDRTAVRHLEPTPAEHFDEAAAWANSNADLVRKLRKNPDGIRRGEYTMSPARSWLARALGVGATKRVLSADEELAELERSVAAGAAAAPGKRSIDEAKAKKLAELRALVDESLRE